MTKKKLSLLVLVALFAFSLEVKAASLKKMKEALLAGTNSADYNDYDDSSPFSVVYKAGSAATMTITNAVLTLQVGESYHVSLATNTYTTMGQMFDAINSTHSGIYKAVATDMRRAESSAYLGTIGSQSIATVYNVLYDSGSAVGIGTTSKLNWSQIGITPREGKRIRLFKVTGNADITSAASTDVITIYKEAKGTGAETEVIKSPILTDGTDKSITFSTNQPYGGLDFKVDERVIVKTVGDEYQDAGAGTTVFYLEW